MRTICICLFVAAVGVGTSGCSGAFSAPDPESNAPPAALIGVWRANVKFAGGQLSDLNDLEFLYSFNAGGTLTQSTNYDGTPPVPPGYGIWRQVGPRRFELKSAFFMAAKFVKVGRSAAWVPGGRGMYTETLELSLDSKGYRSHITYELFNPAGKPIAGGGEGDATGNRIGFDPL